MHTPVKLVGKSCGLMLSIRPTLNSSFVFSAAVRHDGWSSESDDDDFIDVPIPTSISFTRTTVVQSIEPTAVRRTPERKDVRDDVEWNPSVSASKIPIFEKF